jgi:prepilin-type N-terminal cleavage/methylation domain-containing protein
MGVKPTQLRRVGVSAAAFTLMELLAVIAIMAIIVALAMPALKAIQGTALQTAARQVSSALQLARQYAINNRVPVRVVLAVDLSTTPPNQISPDLICRAYTVCRATNDADGNIVGWVPLQDWRVLPEGIVFNNLDLSTYSPMTINEIPILGNSGTRIVSAPPNATDAWRYFDGTNSMTVFLAGGSVTWQRTSAIEYRPTGVARGPGDTGIGGAGAGAIRVAAGSVLNPQNRTLLITDTNNWVYIEFDQWGGRVRTRYRDSYK